MPEVQQIYQTNTTQLPAWMQQSIQDLLTRGTSVANEPYQPYTGPRVAGFSGDQVAGQNFLRDNLTAFAPWLGAAGNYTHMAGGNNIAGAGNAELGAAVDRFGRGANVDSAGMATPFIGEGTDYLRQSTSRKAIDAANPYIAQSVDPMGFNAASPYIQQSTSPTGISFASPYIQQATMPTGLAAASPYLNAASGSFPGAADAYMNPYMRNVTDEIARLGGRNLQENLLPQISDQFVRAGQFGSPQQRDFVGRALRDTQEAVLAQQGQALERGYGVAGQLYGQDAARQAALAGTAGGLGTSQQQALLSAGLGLGGLGQQQQQQLLSAGLGLGNLGQQQQQILQQAGLGLGNLSAGDLNRLQQAGINIGNFGIQQGQLAAGDASRQIQAAQGLAGVGNSLINAANLDAMKNLQAGSQMGQLSNLQNNFVLQNAAALGASGAEQQGQTQRNLDVAYGDFQQQQQYPWQNISNLSSIVHGLPFGTSSTTQGTTTSPSPSTLSQVAGVGLGAAGLANSGLFRAKGGAVKKPRKSTHSYGNVPRRGIAFAEAA